MARIRAAILACVSPRALCREARIAWYAYFRSSAVVCSTSTASVALAALSVALTGVSEKDTGAALIGRVWLRVSLSLPRRSPQKVITTIFYAGAYHRADSFIQASPRVRP